MPLISAKDFTFHYVSILMRQRSRTVQRSGQLYIPLCLYFNTGIRTSSHRSKRLYIPLCLYFNRSDTGSDADDDYFTFHYVSILIFIPQEVQRSVLQLYIPLCLYFNMPSCSASSTAVFLYIPLCLYFNQTRALLQINRQDFTFHYVSILIKRNARWLKYD